MALGDRDGHGYAPPVGQKVQALLALLATAPGHRRRREDLQAFLWSDRSPEQRSASLRQALSTLRQALGPTPAILQADRRDVWIDRLELIEDGSDGEFLANLDIADPAFDAWLRVERGRRSPGAAAERRDPPMARPVVYFLRPPETEAPSGMLASLFADRLALSLSEHFTVEIEDTQARRLGSHKPGDMIFATEAIQEPGLAAFRVALQAGPRRRVWSGHRVAPASVVTTAIDADDVQRLVNEAVESYADAVLADRSGRDQTSAAALAHAGVRQMFTMRPELFAGADDMLERAFFLDPRGTTLAWRTMLRVIRLVERHPGDAAATADEAVAFARTALEMEPTNSLVLAAASNVASLIEGNAAAALEHAQRAARRNETNPFAWDALSTAALHAGQVEEAYVFAVKAQRLAGDTPFKHWYDMGRALMATVTNRLDEAARLAGAATVVPHFKPPLRYIAALHAHMGQADVAHRAIARLTALEPDFSPDRLTSDPDYPVAALRRSEILRKGLFGLL